MVKLKTGGGVLSFRVTEQVFLRACHRVKLSVVELLDTLFYSLQEGRVLLSAERSHEAVFPGLLYVCFERDLGIILGSKYMHEVG